MLQHHRNIMALVNVIAHTSSLRRKRWGIYPQVIQLSGQETTCQPSLFVIQIDTLVIQLDTLSFYSSL